MHYFSHGNNPNQTTFQVQENNSSLTLSRLLAAGNSQRPPSQALTLNPDENTCPNFSRCTLEESQALVGALCAQMNDLMHDYQVVSRIAQLAGTLKGSYEVSLQGKIKKKSFGFNRVFFFFLTWFIWFFEEKNMGF